MFITLKTQIRKLSKQDYLILKQMCRNSKDLYNSTLYEVRQHFFKTGEYLNYLKVNKLMKGREVYKHVKTGIGQQIQRQVDWAFRAFFALLKKAKIGDYPKDKVRIPGYLPKESFWNLILASNTSEFKDGFFTIIPPKILREEKDLLHRYKIKIPFTKKINGPIKRVLISPKQNGRYFELIIVYEHDESKTNLNLNKENLLSIDCGLDNFATCLDCQSGRSFILDGRELKSINRWWNKEVARLKSILDHQNKEKKGGSSKRLGKLHQWRKSQINNALSQMVAHIVKYCARNDIGTIVVGDWGDMKRGIKMARKVKQSFVQIPFSLFKQKLSTQCQKYGISYHLQEESYTSKCSFLDQETITKHERYQGKRIKRGLFRTSKGIHINADVNGAANIAVKSKRRSQIYDLTRPSSGFTSNPKRIRLPDFERSEVRMRDLVAYVASDLKQTSLEVA